MNDSPAAILFDDNGFPVAVVDGYNITADTPGLMIAGSDGTDARLVRTASDGTLRVDPTGTTTQPISASSLPLPTGAATETTLATLLTSSTFTGRINTQGQKTMSASTPVVIASDQSALPVSGTVTANIGTSGSLALDATVAKLTIAQSTALGSNTQALVGGSVTTSAPSYTTGNINPLSLTTSGLLRVDGSGATQPVSGTVAATQSGTWTVQPGNTANTTPWLMTGSGTAGSAATGVLTVQGISGGTTINVGGTANTSAPSWGDGQLRPLSITLAGAVRVDGSAVTQPVSGTITANIGTSGSLALEATQAKLTIAQSTALGSNTQTMVGGSVTTSAPTYTTGNINPLSLTTSGLLRVDASGTTQAVTVSSLPVDTYTVATVSATSSGNTTVVTPASGKKVRLHYVVMNADGANAADVTAGIRFTTGGTIKYKVSLKAGSIFARNVGAGRRYVEGAADEALVINLSASQTVNCTVEYEEI